MRPDTLIEPTLADAYGARDRIAPHLAPTPFLKNRMLSAELGCEAWVKFENLQPTGAFKVRGGVNLLSQLPDEERRRGVVAASTGNHGQSIAYAAQLFDTPALVAVPRGCNPLKKRAMEALGAKVVEVGRDFDEARGWVENYARREGMRYIHSANEPLLIAGVSTVSLEIMERLPDVQTILVPIGAGSGACGHCIVAKVLNPRVEVIGVQAQGSDAVYRAWQTGQDTPLEAAHTFAEGLAARVPFELPMRILRRYIDDIVCVTDDEMRVAMRLLLEATHTVAEPAGAASSAAALRLRERLRDRRVALILSGGNATLETLRVVLEELPPGGPPA